MSSKSVGCSKTREIKSTNGHGRARVGHQNSKTNQYGKLQTFSIIETLPYRVMYFFHFFPCLQPFERQKCCNVSFAMSFDIMGTIVIQDYAYQPD